MRYRRSLVFAVYEEALKCLDPNDLAMVNCSLGFKSVIAGKVYMERSRKQEEHMLSQNNEIIALKKELSLAKEENDVLSKLVDGLKEDRALLADSKNSMEMAYNRLLVEHEKLKKLVKTTCELLNSCEAP